MIYLWCVYERDRTCYPRTEFWAGSKQDALFLAEWHFGRVMEVDLKRGGSK